MFILYNALHTLECYHTISTDCEHTNTVCIRTYIKEPKLLTKSICLISVSVAFSEMFPTKTVVATLMSEADTLFCTARIKHYINIYNIEPLHIPLLYLQAWVAPLLLDWAAFDWLALFLVVPFPIILYKHKQYGRV